MAGRGAASARRERGEIAPDVWRGGMACQAAKRCVLSTEAVDALVIRRPALPAQRDVEAAVAVPDTRPRELADAHRGGVWPGFSVSGDTLPDALQGGQSYSGLTFTPDTSTPGAHSETFTFAPRDVSATTTSYSSAPGTDDTVSTTTTIDGASVAEELPALTVTVTDMVTSAPTGPAVLQAPAAVTLANVRVGQTDTQAVAISNAAAAPAEALDVSATASGAATVSGTVSDLAAGNTDSTDLVAGLETSQAGAISGALSLSPDSDDGSGGLTPLPTAQVSVSGSVFRTASVSVAPVSDILHVGDAGTFAVPIANVAPADGFSENLVASVTGVTGAIAASGSTGEIAAGASGSLQAAVSTAQAGVIAGTVALSLASDGGTGADAVDGLGQIALAPQAVAVNVTVDNYAKAALVSHAGDLTAGATADSYVLDLGTVQLGSKPVDIDLATLNSATGPADALNGTYAFSGDPDFVNTGFSAFTGDAAGQSDAGGTVSLETDQTGTFTETLTLAPTGSNASGYLGALPNQTITITGTVAAPVQAPAVLEAPASVSFANARVGNAESQALAIANAAVAPAASLSVTPSATGGATVTGDVSGLAAGGADDTDIIVSLDTQQAGAVAGSVLLAPTSTGASGSTSLPTTTVAVSGSVFREAQASIMPISEIVHVDDPGTATLDVANIAAADGYSEDLTASVSGTTGDVGAEGASGEIAPDAESGNELHATFSTAQAGVIAGTVGLSLASDGGTGAGAVDGLGETALAPQAVAVNVTIDNYAKAVLVSHAGDITAGPTANNLVLDLGKVELNSTPVSVDLATLNSAAGPADVLDGTYAFSGDPDFVNTGFSAFTGDAAGQSDAGGTVSLETDQAGTFTETLTLVPTGSNASGYLGALPVQTLTITGTVVRDATGAGTGDVHIETFDGLRYDFQAVGDFILAQSTSVVPTFAVQIRAAAWSDQKSVTTELAAKVGADVVWFEADSQTPISIDGLAVTLLPGQTQALADGALTMTSATTYRLVWNTGEVLKITYHDAFLDEVITLGRSDAPGSVEGLLGGDDGPATDFKLPDGTFLTPPVTSADLLGRFADAWRVSADLSMLSTPPTTAGEITEPDALAGVANDRVAGVLAGASAAPAPPTGGSGVVDAKAVLFGQFAAAAFGSASDATSVHYTPAVSQAVLAPGH